MLFICLFYCNLHFFKAENEKCSIYIYITKHIRVNHILIAPGKQAYNSIEEYFAKGGGRLSGAAAGIFALSVVLFLGGIHFFLSIKKPGVYPPKYVLKKRAAALAAGGAFLFLLGLIVGSF